MFLFTSYATTKRNHNANLNFLMRMLLRKSEEKWIKFPFDFNVNHDAQNCTDDWLCFSIIINLCFYVNETSKFILKQFNKEEERRWENNRKNREIFVL